MDLFYLWKRKKLHSHIKVHGVNSHTHVWRPGRINNDQSLKRGLRLIGATATAPTFSINKCAGDRCTIGAINGHNYASPLPCSHRHRKCRAHTSSYPGNTKWSMKDIKVPLSFRDRRTEAVRSNARGSARKLAA